MTDPMRRTAEGVAWRTIGPGDAPPLIACHGMGLDHRDLAEWLGPLAPRRRIILWDMPGHGASDAMPDPCSLAAMTDALEAVRVAAAAERPLLLGFSFGGMVAQEWLRRGGRARGLVAMACYAPFSVAPLVPRERIEPDVIAPSAALPWETLREAFLGACSAEPGVRDALRPRVERVGRDGLLAMTSALLTAFDPATPWSPDLPLLVLRGDADANGAALAQSAAALTADLAIGREAVIPGAGHMLHMERPEETLAALTAFVEDVEGRA